MFPVGETKKGGELMVTTMTTRQLTEHVSGGGDEDWRGVGGHHDVQQVRGPAADIVLRSDGQLVARGRTGTQEPLAWEEPHAELCTQHREGDTVR